MLDCKEEFYKLLGDINALRKDEGTKSCRLSEKRKNDMHRKICGLVAKAAGYQTYPNNEVTFDDVEGCADAKEKLKRLAWWKNPDNDHLLLFEECRDCTKRENLILFGPSGVGKISISVARTYQLTSFPHIVIWGSGNLSGKTMLGKAFANERGAKLFYLPSTCLVRMDVWEKRRLLSLVIEAAYAMTPSVIFLDEEAGAPLSSLLNNYAPGCEELATLIKADWKAEYDVTFIAATSQPHSFDDWALNRLASGGSNADTDCYYIPSPDLPALEASLPCCASNESLNELARKTNELTYYDDLDQLLKKLKKEDKWFINHADMCVHLKAMALSRQPRALRSGRQL